MVLWPRGASCFSDNNCRIGKAKAAVFPVPVCADVITSFFAKTCGIVCNCTAVGCVYPCSSIAFKSGLINFKSLNDICCIFEAKIHEKFGVDLDNVCL